MMTYRPMSTCSRTVLVLLLAALLVLPACGDDRRALAGSYTARSEDGTTVNLVLKHDGKGAWTHGGITASITWERRSENAIWLRTKDGGVLRGQLNNGGIVLELPGGDVFTFTKP